MSMNYAVWHFVKPSHLLLYLLVLGLLFAGRRSGRTAVVLAAGGLLACAVLPVAALLAKPLEDRFPRPSFGHVDGIVVLAGAEKAMSSALRGEPQLSEHADRLTTFLRLANQFPQARLAHAGGAAGSMHDQSRVARDVILGAGIDPQRIVFEDRSGNTCESALKAKGLLAPQAHETWLLVTSAVHMPRAVACFEAAGWSVTAYPTDYQTGASLWSFGLVDNLRLLDLAAHEWAGLAYYRFRGLIFPSSRTGA